MRTKWIRHFLAMFLLVFSLTLLGQSGQAQEILWTSPYGGRDVATDSAENVLLTGGKLSPDGDSLWMRSPSGLTARGVAADPWGNVIVSGYIYTDTASLEDYCTVEYNPDGDTLWAKIYYDIGGFYDVATDTSGSIVVIKTIYSTSGSDYYTLIMKLDANGDTLWTSRCDSLQCDGVTTDLSGNVIVTGNKTVKYRGNSGVEGENGYSFPKVFSLLQNWPNPFNATTAIGYQLSAVSSQRSA